MLSLIGVRATGAIALPADALALAESPTGLLDVATTTSS